VTADTHMRRECACTQGVWFIASERQGALLCVPVHSACHLPPGDLASSVFVLSGTVAQILICGTVMSGCAPEDPWQQTRPGCEV